MVRTWELDVFAGANEGLVMAEIELGSADEPFELPGWARADVSDDARYFNVNLAQHPIRGGAPAARPVVAASSGPSVAVNFR